MQKPAPTPSYAHRFRLATQREICRILSPLTVFAVVGLLRFGLGLRFENHREIRREYWARRPASGEPLLICANHLTMIDSALVAWALASPLQYLRHFSALPWNVPERRNFASTTPTRILAYVLKCLPIVRGGKRSEVAGPLALFSYAVSRGEVGLIFPEGGRSRSGRVEIENAARGVGRIVRSVPGCRVLCVYVRGDRQRSYSRIPARGDRLRARLAWLEPKTDHAGVRGSHQIARQIVTRLAELEGEHFDGRQ